MFIVTTRVKFWIFILLHEGHPLSHRSPKKGQVIWCFASAKFLTPFCSATGDSHSQQKDSALDGKGSGLWTWFNQALEKQTWIWLLLHRWQKYCTPTSGRGSWCIRRKNMSVCYLNKETVFWKSIFKVVAKQRLRHFILFASPMMR